MPFAYPFRVRARVRGLGCIVALLAISVIAGCSGANGSEGDSKTDAGALGDDAGGAVVGDARADANDAGGEIVGDAAADALANACPSADADAGSCEPFLTSGGRGGDMVLTWPCNAPLTPGQKSYKAGKADAFWDQCVELCPSYGTPALATCTSSTDACHRTTLFCEYQRL